MRERWILVGVLGGAIASLFLWQYIAGEGASSKVYPRGEKPSGIVDSSTHVNEPVAALSASRTSDTDGNVQSVFSIREDNESAELPSHDTTVEVEQIFNVRHEYNIQQTDSAINVFQNEIMIDLESLSQDVQNAELRIAVRDKLSSADEYRREILQKAKSVNSFITDIDQQK